jgi:hypothetical protein
MPETSLSLYLLLCLSFHSVNTRPVEPAPAIRYRGCAWFAITVKAVLAQREQFRPDFKGKMANHLFYGDNVQVLREHVKDESVDLIYLDPPFNSLRIPRAGSFYWRLPRSPSAHSSARWRGWGSQFPKRCSDHTNLCHPERTRISCCAAADMAACAAFRKVVHRRCRPAGDETGFVWGSLRAGQWVPHISLVFREMWDTTSLDRPVFHPTGKER